MSVLAVPYTYHYPFSSRFDSGKLRLATFAPGAVAPPHFFTGHLHRPRRTADLLRGLMTIVQSRFHVPAVMLGKIIALSDPVVTSSDERLRFEGFSACCGAYARLDLLPESVRGETFGRGTTNVDFNQPMLSALAMVRDGDKVTLNVGVDHVELSRNAEMVIEKKVALPVRWLKGFVEVQSCQSRMRLMHDIGGMEAWKFLRSLPRMKTNRRETFVVASGRGLRLSQIAVREAVRVGGLERLRVLENLAADAKSLRIYGDPVTGASAWELVFDDCRFHLVISPEVWRGFSGEGQALHSLASNEWEPILPQIKAHLAWQAVINEVALQQATVVGNSLALTSIRAALAALGGQGLVGFDLAEGSYFHRELPFDLEKIDQLHPRLKAARKLLAEQSVRLGTSTKAQTEVIVASSGVEHRVRLTEGDPKCTCPWFAKHANTRGPCKHILAAQILLEETEHE